jgi:transposase
LSIDEVALTKGELYTIVTNKEKKGRQGCLVAIMEGTESKIINTILDKINQQERNKVKEVTLDMARNMEASVRQSFINAVLVTDHFHVVKLVLDALQHIRVKFRWQAIDEENKEMKKAKDEQVRYQPKVLSNGDTAKQLLARSRYLLYKFPDNWTSSQARRSELLFSLYPLLRKAYQVSNQFRTIYNLQSVDMAKIRFAQWMEDVKTLAIEEFNSVLYSIKYHQDSILNFFINRSTNASAESFNAKIKGFRAMQRGITDNKFFLFRLEKLFA